MMIGFDLGAWLELPTGERRVVRGSFSLGRSDDNDLRLGDHRVSRRHALIHVQGAGEFWLVDLGSSNGTALNGCRAGRPMPLHDGDRISIGPFDLVFRHPAPPEASVPRTLASGPTEVEIRRSRLWLVVADIPGSTTRMNRTQSPDRMAVRIGRWFRECRKIVESTGGTVNKYLGDGFLAYWNEDASAANAVADALAALHGLQDSGETSFRFVVHVGDVYVGGTPTHGEESLSGPDVNLVFRMEQLAAELGAPRLASEPACQGLHGALRTLEAVRHRVPGFEGEFTFHRF